MKFKREANPDSPVSLDEIKAELRIVDDEENRLLGRKINAAYRLIEKAVNQDILVATYKGSDTYTAGAEIHVALPDNASNIEVVNGTYEVVDNTLIVTVVADGVVKISYKDGLFAFADDMDPDMHQAISLLAVHFYENRDQPETGIPYSVEALIQPWKVYF